MRLAHDQLRILAEALHSQRDAPTGTHALTQLARQQTALLEALPVRYQEVLLQLLDRLDSSALFSEESCSFSQKDLLSSLQTWVDKASAQLPAPPGPSA